MKTISSRGQHQGDQIASTIDSLIFGYLKRKQYSKTLNALLSESPHLTKYATTVPNAPNHFVLNVNCFLHDQNLEQIIHNVYNYGRFVASPNLLDLREKLLDLASEFETELYCRRSYSNNEPRFDGQEGRVRPPQNQAVLNDQMLFVNQQDVGMRSAYNLQPSSQSVNEGTRNDDTGLQFSQAMESESFDGRKKESSSRYDKDDREERTRREKEEQKKIIDAQKRQMKAEERARHKKKEDENRKRELKEKDDEKRREKEKEIKKVEDERRNELERRRRKEALLGKSNEKDQQTAERMIGKWTASQFQEALKLIPNDPKMVEDLAKKITYEYFTQVVRKKKGIHHRHSSTGSEADSTEDSRRGEDGTRTEDGQRGRTEEGRRIEDGMEEEEQSGKESSQPSLEPRNTLNDYAHHGFDQSLDNQSMDSETFEMSKKINSSRMMQYSESSNESDGDSEPSMKKTKSDSTIMKEKKAESSQKSWRALECFECRYHGATAKSLTEHLRKKHDTTLTLAGFALRCDCGFEALSEDHSNKCKIAKFTLIRKRDGPIRRISDEKTTPQCIKCDAFPKTAAGYIEHLRIDHNTTLTSGIYLLCSCGVNYRYDNPNRNHTKTCNFREYTLHKMFDK